MAKNVIIRLYPAGIQFKDLNLGFRLCMFLCTILKCIKIVYKIWDSVHKIWDSAFKSGKHGSMESP